MFFLSERNFQNIREKTKKSVFLKDAFYTITITEVNYISEQKFNQSIKVETIPFFLFPTVVLRSLCDVELLIVFVEPSGNGVRVMLVHVEK